jgi:aryl-alcohol dehydrogenase-like predicted oxidoreductase
LIPGHATPHETSSLNIAPGKIQYTTLGSTGLSASRAGFGGYRITDGITTHENALRRALEGGINLIDTSANYTDGGSELLVGRVLSDLIQSKTVSRQQITVVSKVGYLQGQNHALSQQRKQEGRPFKELVPYSENLEHCIHPEFLEDQLDRSLERLGLETLDFYLLHNPEYYLDWANKEGLPMEEARKTYYHRIEKAFVHLEKEVRRGRILYYGISSNTFPSPADDPEFTSLETVWNIALTISVEHHFRLIQLPLNLLEPGGMLEQNQSGTQTVLGFAADKNICVLINRPLNAFTGNQLIRLADIKPTRTQSENDIIRAIRAVNKSETRLWRRILPELDIPAGVIIRIKEQIAISDMLKHYWRNFGSYERWRQLRDNNFQPRNQGVIDYLGQIDNGNETLQTWMADHATCLKRAFQAVGSIYAESAARTVEKIRQAVTLADTDWAGDGTLSQKALRVVGSSSGVSTVLVGMRRERYVEDVLGELQRPVDQRERRQSWQALQEILQKQQIA